MEESPFKGKTGVERILNACTCSLHGPSVQLIRPRQGDG